MALVQWCSGFCIFSISTFFGEDRLAGGQRLFKSTLARFGKLSAVRSQSFLTKVERIRRRPGKTVQYL